MKLDDAVRAGIYAINIDSLTRSNWWNNQSSACAARRHIAPARNHAAPRAEIGTRSHLGLQTALLTSKFGISSSEVLSAFRRGLQRPDLCSFAAFIFTSARRRPTWEPFAEAFTEHVEHLRQIHRETGHTLEHINLVVVFPSTICAIVRSGPTAEHEREMLARAEPSAVLTRRSESRVNSARAASEHLSIK